MNKKNSCFQSYLTEVEMLSTKKNVTTIDKAKVYCFTIDLVHRVSKRLIKVYIFPFEKCTIKFTYFFNENNMI